MSLKITYSEESGKTEKIKKIKGDSIDMQPQGIKYLDPETGMIHLEMWNNIDRIEIDCVVSEDQKEYSRAFRLAYSDNNKPRSLINRAPRD